jgi:superfamily II DNA or RNA helicase
VTVLLFAKGGPGSGNHGHGGRPGKIGGSGPGVERLADDYLPPSSANVTTAEEARAYWKANLQGRTIEMGAKAGGREFTFKVHLGEGSHGWTRGSDKDAPRPDGPVEARDGGDRWFDPERARRLDLIIPTLLRPYKLVEGSEGSSLYVYYKPVDGRGRYVVALKPIDGTQDQEWRFASAHIHEGSRGDAVLKRRPVGKGMLRKAESPAEAGLGAELRNDGGFTPTPSLDDARWDTLAGAGIVPITYVAKFYTLFKAIEAGERWITVFPNGHDHKGTPVLIQPQADGSAKIIGGAGNSLNHLRLTGVKPQGSYKEAIAGRAKDRRERGKARRERDKEAGLLESKKAAHDKVKDQTREAQKAYIEDVAGAMGWDPGETKFSAPEGTPDEELGAMATAHHQALMERARAAVNLNRQTLLADADARTQTAFGDIPLESDSAELSVQDIDPVAMPTGLGFSPDYKGRAEAGGATDEDVRAEAEAVTGKLHGKKTESKIGKALELMREKLGPDTLAAKLVDAKTTLDLLKADKKRRLAEQKARKAHQAIDEATSEPKATVIDVDDAHLDKAVAEEMANDLRTISTRAFLNEIGKVSSDPVKALSRHVGEGAYNAVNAAALAAGGAALVDRSVVDVLGIAGAAEVLARRLKADLSPEAFEDVVAAQEAYHVEHYMAATDEALARAKELQAHAAEIELGTISADGDLAVLQEANRLRANATHEAAAIMGRTLGETEANAALVYALKRSSSDKPFEVSLGDVPVEGAIRQLRAIGLQRGDYALESISGNRVVSISPAGLQRLAEPVAKADLEQVRRNLDIISGAQDEEGWLPKGFANRPDLGMDLKPGVAPRLAEPFRPGPNLEESISDYIGGRAADGDAPADIVSDLQSAAFFQKVGGDRSAEYRALLDKLAPLQDAKGKMQTPDALRSSFEAMADAYVGKRGGQQAAIHRQTFEPNEVAADAVHRALSEEPAGVAAYKPVGEMTPNDQGALREWFAKNVAKESPDAAALRQELEGMAEPEREIEDMFGDKGVNPEWQDWRSKKTELTQNLNAMSLTWPKYVETMRSPQAAYAAVQDLVQSRVGEAFARHYNTLNPKAPLKVGKASIRGALNHLDATDPKARDERLTRERALVDRLRERAQGKYASGAVSDKLDAMREEEAGLQAAQMGFFADEVEDQEQRPVGKDERHSLGQAADRQLAKLVGAVGQNFKPGQPVKLFKPTMSGGQNWARQRAIKYIAANKRAVLSFGVGSGKTAVSLGAFSHLHSEGQVKRGLFLAPSIAQGNFGADALRFLEPGKFKWHCVPGASRAERLEAYRDPTNDFAVVTHQAFRDDLVHLGAEQAGISEAEMGAKLSAMPRAARANWMRSTLRQHGAEFDFLAVDEGHGLLNREGKENSQLADVVDALGDTSSVYANMSADPLKNDVSELFSLLQKMDPERYQDQAAFMRRYGGNTAAAQAGLRREMARFQYPSKIDPDITATTTEHSVPVSEGQQKALAELDRNLARVRLARLRGETDVAAAQAISPQSFEGVDPAGYDAVARAVSRSVGIIKESAVRRILDSHPDGGKVDAISRLAADRKGKPGVVFAHSLDAVKAIEKRLAGEGYRVATITGKDNAEAKADVVRRFNPDSGERQTDIVVASDAGAVGANLQSGTWLVQADVPMTALTSAQRSGRINRFGQKHNVELFDLVSDHPSDRRARARLREKFMLRDLATSPLEALDDSGLAYFLKQRRVQREQGGAT